VLYDLTVTVMSVKWVLDDLCHQFLTLCSAADLFLMKTLCRCMDLCFP